MTTVTANPAEGDYILSPTGFSWNVRRSNGNGSVQSISSGDRDRKTAMAKLLSLAEAGNGDAWETSGTSLFWLIKRFRRED